MGSEHVWAWTKSKRKTYKVISDPEKGIIEVYNERGDIVLRRDNLSRRHVELVEKRVLSAVAKRTDEHATTKPPRPPAGDPFDPMIT